MKYVCTKKKNTPHRVCHFMKNDGTAEEKTESFIYFNDDSERPSLVGRWHNQFNPKPKKLNRNFFLRFCYFSLRFIEFHCKSFSITQHNTTQKVYANSFQLFTFIWNRDWIDAVPRIHSLYQFDIFSEFRNWSWINLHSSVRRHVRWNSIEKSGQKFHLNREKKESGNVTTFTLPSLWLENIMHTMCVCWLFQCLLKIIRILFISRTCIVLNRLQKTWWCACYIRACMSASVSVQALSVPKLGTDAGYKAKEHARVKIENGRQSECAMAYGVRFPHDLNRWGYANGRELGS